MGEKIALGIDLGTTNTVAAIFKKDGPKIVVNKEGNRLTPSFVYYVKGKWIIGDHAKLMSNNAPEFGVYETKRLIGRKFGDNTMEKSLKYFAFTVNNDNDNNPLIVIKQGDEVIKKTPSEISSMVLMKIKRDIEHQLGEGVIREAVITVPAYFNQSQREATLAAAKSAGLTVLKLLNEPTATALMHFYKKEAKNGDNFLIFDLGGGTFDVAILKKTPEGVDVVAVNGDTALGGHDIDNLLIEYIVRKLETDYNYSPLNNKRQMRRLRNKCEEAKRILTNSEELDEVPICLDNFIEGPEPLEIMLTKNIFEELTQNLFERIINIVDSTLIGSNIKKSDIVEVILAGGSCRILSLQKMLSRYFDGKALCRFQHLDECVAKGAALQAAMILNQAPGDLDRIRIHDVIPLSLGSAGLVNEMDFQIRRNTRIPTDKVHIMANLHENQEVMSFKIYEGERLNCKHNKYLGEILLNNLTPSLPGQCRVELKLHVNENGILEVTAREVGQDNENRIQIEYIPSRINDNEVKNAQKDAEDNREQDEKFMRYVERVTSLRTHCNLVISKINELNLQSEYSELYELCVVTEIEIEEMKVEDVRDIEERIAIVKSFTTDFESKYSDVFISIL